MGGGQHQVDIDMIGSHFINGAKAHLSQQRHSGLHRVHLKRAYFPVFGEEIIKQPDAVFGLSLQKIIKRITAAGVRLVFIIELVSAFGAGPHSMC